MTYPIIGKILETMLLAFILFLNFFAYNGFEINLFSKRPANFYLGGIQVNEPDQQTWVKTIEKLGMNTMAVSIETMQWEWDGDSLFSINQDSSIIAQIDAAKTEELRVVAVARLRLDQTNPRNKHLWHGFIFPQTIENVDGWFLEYGALLKKWARLCEEKGVDVFAIGSELNMMAAVDSITVMPGLLSYYLTEWKLRQAAEELQNLTHPSVADTTQPDLVEDLTARADWAKQVSFYSSENPIFEMNRRRRYIQEKWTTLIAEVRQIYHGKLTYAANFDNYHKTSLWSALDIIGINAYFPLRDDINQKQSYELEAVFTSKWQNILADIHAFRKNRKLENKPVLFTELGYTIHKYSSLKPWQSKGITVVNSDQGRQALRIEEQPVDYLERAMVIRALRNAYDSGNFSLPNGILYWKLSTLNYHEHSEPFVMHLSLQSRDPGLKELLRFLR